MEHVADKDMVRNALGDETDELARPPNVDAPMSHPLWLAVEKSMQEVYDPEIPVNIYELGRIYLVEIDDKHNVSVKMSLTAPGCPVAGEMPGMVERAIRTVEDVNDIDVELVWDPPWDPSFMAETAKLQLNMF
jgi:FeS assembly SUF system protein